MNVPRNGKALGLNWESHISSIRVPLWVDDDGKQRRKKKSEKDRIND